MFTEVKYCFSSQKVLQKYRQNCLIINGKQRVKLKSGSIKFKNHFKQLTVPFKIYADFECNAKGVKSNDNNNNASYIKIIFLAVLLAKLCVLMIDLASQLFNTDSNEVINAGYAIIYLI